VVRAHFKLWISSTAVLAIRGLFAIYSADELEEIMSAVSSIITMSF